MYFTVKTEQEIDGRWISEVLEIPGSMKYGKTKHEAVASAVAFAEDHALRVIAERIESGEKIVGLINIIFVDFDERYFYGRDK